MGNLESNLLNCETKRDFELYWRIKKQRGYFFGRIFEETRGVEGELEILGILEWKFGNF